MIAFNETVTLVKHIQGEDADTYTCTVYGGASWFAKDVIVTSADGAKPANTFVVRIKSTEDIAAAPGDYVAKGVIESITKPADLKGLDYFRITSVGDNRRGGLPHWRVSGS